MKVEYRDNHVMPIRIIKSVLRYWLLILCGLVFQAVKADMPSKTDRLYSLSKIWQEVNYTFADADRYNAVNVDSLYKAYLPLMADVDDEYEYYQLLNAFLANFREGHTRIMPPSSPPYDFPKLDIEHIDSILYVSDTSERLSMEVHRFSKVLKVNGVDAFKFLTDSVAPYISATTDRWRLDKSALQLLYGKPDTDVTLTICTPDGSERELTLSRNAKSDTTDMLRSKPTMEFNWLNDSILLMNFNTCADLQGARQIFLSHLNDVSSAKGIIIDVRNNRGGTEESWYLPAFLMLNMDECSYKGHDIKRSNTPNDMSTKPAFSNGTYEYHQPSIKYPNGIPAEYRIDTPLVILSGKYTGSAAETFVQLMRENHPNLKIIGEPSTGCPSVPKFVPLPGDYTLMIAEGVYYDAEGNSIGHTGIIPDETIYPTFAQIVNGYDPALERAVEILTI